MRIRGRLERVERRFKDEEATTEVVFGFAAKVRELDAEIAKVDAVIETLARLDRLETEMNNAEASMRPEELARARKSKGGSMPAYCHSARSTRGSRF